MPCRVCNGSLSVIVDMDWQCLGGQFPKIGEPDPPRHPLALARCVDCGLVQLRDRLPREAMFTDYHYRSGVTQTMRDHLAGIARQAVDLLGRKPLAVLDIGGNDGTLLSHFSYATTACVDPCEMHMGFLPSIYKRGFWPDCMRGEPFGKFDLIFSIACFYDSNYPVLFARAVADSLSPTGLWVVEVSDLSAVLCGAWDSICHEHAVYYDMNGLTKAMALSGLCLIMAERNKCNGGSIRAVIAKSHEAVERLACHIPAVFGETSISEFHFETLRLFISQSSRQLRKYLNECKVAKRRVHLLGASTKANTVLQYAGVGPFWIEKASDRDPAKAGRCTPGTRIPIVSEGESRADNPDVYVCLLHHFKDEIIAREKEFLDKGGTLVFPLPKFEEVKGVKD